jgi:hypothetical protein
VTTTLFDTQPAIADDRAGTLGVIGIRQLVAVQTFDIARLTSHPVAIIPSSFVAVTGRGPRDSNESGKTSFNAAVALLLGDPEWRVTGGGVAAVAELLFEPDTAGVAATRYPAAQTGFIAGVFAEPDDVEGTAYTAWMKLSSTPKYLLVRHAPGVHLVMADTDTEQHRQAPAAWASLPVASELGAQTYVDTLYGRSPRCLAYVTARGKQRSGPSLLKMDTGAFTPADIGAALMRLTGRSETLETERDQRRKLAQKTSELAEAKSDHVRMGAQEEETLRGVRLRTAIRGKLDAGQHLLHQHLARGLLDTLVRRDALQAELDDARALTEEGAATLAARQSFETSIADGTEVAERAAKADEAHQVASERHTDASNKVAVLTSNAATIRQELIVLEEKGARDFHLDVAAATTALESSREERAKADARAAAADEKVSALEDEFAKAAAGRLGAAGRAIEILAAAPASIEAVGLLDAVEVADDHRDLWEARLLPWRDAVCVPASVRERALAALAQSPGSVVISGPARDPERLRGEPGASGHLPGGLLAAPPAAVPFLTYLAARVHPSETPEAMAAHDSELGVDIIGGFADPITGHAHILAGLEHQLRDARKEQRQATDSAGLAKRLHRQAEDDLVSAQAAEQYRARAAELRRIEAEDLPRARELEVQRKVALDRALEDHTQAQTELRGLEAALTRARKEREEAEFALSAARIEAAQAQRALEDIDLSYWVAGFGDTESEARATLNWANDHLDADADRQIARLPGPHDPSQPVEKRTRDTLRNRANECLTEIITKLDIERATGHGSPTREIAEAVRRREHLADSSGTPLGRDEIASPGWRTPSANGCCTCRNATSWPKSRSVLPGTSAKPRSPSPSIVWQVWRTAWPTSRTALSSASKAT